MTRALQIAILTLLAGAIAPRAAHSQPAEADAGKVRVAVFVAPSASHLSLTDRTKILLAAQRALRRNRRLEVVDKDVRLADLAKQIPHEAISEARGLLESGEALLRKGRAGPAEIRLSTAARLLDRGLAFVSKQELARAQFLVGAANAVLGKQESARSWFIRLQVWRPTYVVDTGIAPAQVMPLWQAAREQVNSRPGGSIEIRSSPRGALTYVDGSLLGAAPVTAEALTTGEHYVTLKLVGYQRQVKKVRVSGEIQLSVSETLQPSSGQEELQEHADGVIAGLGAPKASSVMTKLAKLLDIEHALFVRVPAPDDPEDDAYEAFLYDTHTRKRLARAEAPASTESDRAAMIGELADTVYAGLAIRPRPKPKQVRKPKKKRRGKPFYRKWWFWTGLTAAVTIPVLWSVNLSFDIDRGPRCPPNNVCGQVLLKF